MGKTGMAEPDLRLGIREDTGACRVVQGRWREGPAEPQPLGRRTAAPQCSPPRLQQREGMEDAVCNIEI